MQPNNIHHITYEFPTAGLSEAAIAFHTAEALDSLSEHFGVDRSKVIVRTGARYEHDVHVMTGEGNVADYVRKIAAMRVVAPLFYYLTYEPVVVDEKAHPQDLGQSVVLRLVRPTTPRFAGVRHG